jgi:hypothetical protein
MQTRLTKTGIAGLIAASVTWCTAVAAPVFTDSDFVGFTNWYIPFGGVAAVSTFPGNPTTVMQVGSTSSGASIGYGASTLQTFGPDYDIEFDGGQKPSLGRIYANFRQGPFTAATSDPANSARIGTVAGGFLIYQEYNFLADGTETIKKSVVVASGMPEGGWHHWVISSVSTNIRGTIDGIPFSVNPADVTVFGGNYSVGFGNFVGEQEIGIDNVMVTPEPSIVALLGLGGLLLLRARRG